MPLHTGEGTDVQRGQKPVTGKWYPYNSLHCIDLGWMDGWMDEQMDEQMDKWTNGQADRWVDG